MPVDELGAASIATRGAGGGRPRTPVVDDLVTAGVVPGPNGWSLWGDPEP